MSQSSICLVIKLDDGTVKSMDVDSVLLPQIVTNPRLYDLDMSFFEDIIETHKNTIIPIYHKDDGILIIDIPNKKILDSQGYTGVNKITPEEITASKKGNIVIETSNDNVLKRFIELINLGRLIGFEEWRDSGTIINKSIVHLSVDELLEMVDTIRHVGQFVFSTRPFELTTYCETNSSDQFELMTYLIEHNYLNETEITIWNDLIRKLKK